jgi:hypothetical protein
MSLPTSPSIGEVVAELKATTSQEECLRRAYDILANKYHGGHGKTYTRIWRLWPQAPEKLWTTSGFLHCTNFNKLLRTLLLGSGKFSAEDVRTRWTLIAISPHQYSRVRIGDRWINVDVWANTFGIRLGDYAHGFHY